MVNIDDFNFANNLYTRISDLKDPSVSDNYKIKNDDLSRSRKFKDDIEIKRKNNNLDYLYYEFKYYFIIFYF